MQRRNLRAQYVIEALVKNRMVFLMGKIKRMPSRQSLTAFAYGVAQEFELDGVFQ